MRLVPAIDILNDLPPDGFAEALRPLFETAPSLAQSLYARRPYAAYEQLIDTAEALARKMSFEQRLDELDRRDLTGPNQFGNLRGCQLVQRGGGARHGSASDGSSGSWITRQMAVAANRSAVCKVVLPARSSP